MESHDFLGERHDAVRLFPNRDFRSAVDDLLESLVALVVPLLADNGFTICPRSLSEPAFHPDVWLVSLDGFELVTVEDPTPEALRGWLHGVFPRLCAPLTYVGGWRDDEYYHLDLTIPVRGRKTALERAVVERQRFVYHPTTGRALPVFAQPGREAA